MDSHTSRRPRVSEGTWCLLCRARGLHRPGDMLGPACRLGRQPVVSLPWPWEPGATWWSPRPKPDAATWRHNVPLTLGVTSAGFGSTLLCRMATEEGNDGGRARLAGGAIPGPPPSPAGGGLPDARLAHRGRRRRPGNLAAAHPQPHRHERGPQPGRLADDAGRAGVPGHAARAHRTARGTPGAHLPDPIVSRQDGDGPEQQALLAEGVGLALLVVLDTLTPAERLAFVLHDMFAVPFDKIAEIDILGDPARLRRLDPA